MSGFDPEQRLAELGRAMDGYPAAVEAARERLEAVKERTVLGRDPNGLVTVEVTAAGVVTDVIISAAAMRDADDRRLAHCVRAAANEALARADDLVAEAAGHAGDDELDAHFDAFESRMDAILDNLDRMAARLDDLPR